jgi:Peptide methionine sulfoxide reductase
VIATRVGFMGGSIPNPTYEEVGSGSTGHWEVVQVVYDPGKISFASLLAIFWDMVDHPAPSSGAEGEPRFLPAIFFHSAEQERQVQASREERRQAGTAGEIHLAPASEFYEAEEHHQQFYEKCGRGYAAQPHYYE